ncbi:hypothetical protein GcC1_219041 [Golovinomyces cichoracearum]|uniref:Uncharacterized protein n=1 Tax=Golovinomyces cichoracearum TaxID=62708 RepID=A0A420H856_9PEZI|nr:hypothetical protein GcC1_219041 [Golovinomyces cichoracearum]
MSEYLNPVDTPMDFKNSIHEQQSEPSQSQEQRNHGSEESNFPNLPPAMYEAICEKISRQIMNQFTSHFTKVPNSNVSNFPTSIPNSTPQPVNVHMKGNKWPVGTAT